jgi:HEAT repeat protein
MMAQRHGFTTRLRALYVDASPKNRKHIRPWVQQLVDAGVRSSRDLIDLLTDTSQDDRLRLFACRALWVMRNRRAAPAFVQVLSDDPNLTLANETAIGLEALRSQTVVPALIKALRAGKHPGNRVAAAWTLGNVHAKTAVPMLLRVLADQREDPDVRAECAEALGNIGLRRAVLPLIRALTDTSPEVRFWAAFALGKIGDRRALPHLERLSTDQTVIPRWWAISKEASDAITSIRGIGDR